MLGALGLENDPLFKLAMTLEKIALEDDYFVEKKLYPNVDFYSGIILDAMGFPTAMFTPSQMPSHITRASAVTRAASSAMPFTFSMTASE